VRLVVILEGLRLLVGVLGGVLVSYGLWKAGMTGDADSLNSDESDEYVKPVF
jgi:hypothetical protein